MTNYPELEVMFNNGYFVMATPFFATEYSMRHTDLPEDAGKRTLTGYYDCGHMLCLNPKALPKPDRNINRFITKASSKN
jgi:carboxypeptidase C (cathepsin A)